MRFTLRRLLQMGHAVTVLATAAAVVVGTTAAAGMPGAEEFADRAAKIAAQEDGIVRVALYVAATAILALVWLVSLMFRYVGRVTVALERLAQKPCILERDGGFSPPEM